MIDLSLPENSFVSKIIKNLSPDISNQLEEALIVYDNIREKEEVKADKLRMVFTNIYKEILDNHLNDLNAYQTTFLCTGIIGDKIKIITTSNSTANKSAEGLLMESEDNKNVKGKVIELLPEGTAEKVARLILESSSLPSWTDNIYSAIDKMKAIARGDLNPLDLERSTAVKVKTDKKLTQAKEREEAITKKKFVIEETINKILALKKILSLFTTIAGDDNLMKIERDSNELLTFSKFIDDAKLPSEELESMRAQAQTIVQNILKFSKTLEKIQQQIDSITNDLDGKFLNLREIISFMSFSDAAEKKASRKNFFVAFDEEKIKLVKKDFELTNTIINKGAIRSPLRIPTSASRVLIKEHLSKNVNPVEEIFCTTQNVTASLLKLTKIHINLFPKDENGYPIFPPIIIEPIRNYVEWFDDRIIMSYVSGEIGRKGPKYTFTAVDMQVLKAMGLYLAKDPIFNYRGERNEGVFMADYAGKIEKKAVVKWTGEQKKMTMMTATKITDEAGRDEAIKDYMEFVFNLANDYPPPGRLSIRKVAVLLQYVVIESLEKNASLILRYVGQGDPRQAREILLNFCGRRTKDAKNLALAAFAYDSQLAKFYQNNPDMMLERIFGKEAT